jgi:Ca2+-binding RTX toxin-like protein
MRDFCKLRHRRAVPAATGLGECLGNVTPENTAGSSRADTIVGGGSRDTIRGGGGNDQLKGGSERDTLRGDSGNDRLDGGTGKDTLYGGSGKDAFLFTTKPSSSNVDTLRDFSAKDDAIWLENAIYKGIDSGSLAKPKTMLADAFQIGAVAQDAEDRILYDQATGSLYYDRDGTGAAAASRFAVVATKKALTHQDFFAI